MAKKHTSRMTNRVDLGAVAFHSAKKRSRLIMREEQVTDKFGKLTTRLVPDHVIFKHPAQ